MGGARARRWAVRWRAVTYAAARGALEARWLAEPPRPADAFAEGEAVAPDPHAQACPPL